MTGRSMCLFVTLFVLASSLLGLAGPVHAAEALLPPDWAGLWDIRTVYADPVTGAVAAVDRIKDVLYPNEPLGLALFTTEVSCAGTTTDTRLTVDCTSQLSQGPCNVRGTMHLAIDRAGETLAGGGVWQAATTGVCGKLVSHGESIAITGTRLAPPGTLVRPVGVVQKFVVRPVAQVLSVRPLDLFVVDKLEIEHHEFEVRGRLMLDAASNGIAPVTEPVRLQVGSFTALIPPGSFKAKANKGSPPSFTFEGTVAGARLEVKLTPADDGSIEFKAEAKQVSLAPAPGLVPVALTIGDDGGTTAVRAGHED